MSEDIGIQVNYSRNVDFLLSSRGASRKQGGVGSILPSVKLPDQTPEKGEKRQKLLLKNGADLRTMNLPLFTMTRSYFCFIEMSGCR